MRSYIAAAGVLALAATANAANCNPSYNATSAGSCIDNCNSNSAKTYDSAWTSDPTSDHFIASLALMCDKVKSGSLYTAFMSAAGMCMTACTTDEQNAFFTEYSQACAWYTAHANDTCADGTSSSSNSSSNSGNSTTSASDNSETASSTSAAGKLEYGAITAAAVAFAAFIAL